MKIKDLSDSGVDQLTILITRDQIEQNDVDTPLNILRQLLNDKAVSKFYQGRVDLIFDGFNSSREELWEMQEVRKYVMALDSEFPYWLFFLSRSGIGLSVVIRCFLLPHLNAAGNKQFNLPRLRSYLENRGFPAMNQLCNALEMSEAENIQISDDAMTYIQTRILL